MNLHKLYTHIGYQVINFQENREERSLLEKKTAEVCSFDTFLTEGKRVALILWHKPIP